MSADLFQVRKHIVPGQYIREYPHATLEGKNEALKICLNQYVPLDNLSPKAGDVTFIAAHANGVCKELYEPLWYELVQYLHKNTDVKVRGIWMADVAFQGESGVLNEKVLGNDPSWFDHPRDLIHIINLFRNEMPQPLVGIGHSMGGQNIAQAALWHPRLFSAVVLIDPVIVRSPSEGPSKVKGYAPAVVSTFRRDVWPSRTAAAEAFRKNPFYQSWDARVLELFLKYGLRDLPTQIYPHMPDSMKASEGLQQPDVTVAASGKKDSAPYLKTPVTLTTSKHQEVFTFERPKYGKPGQDLSTYKPPTTTHPDILSSTRPEWPFYRPEPILTFAQLPSLRPRCLFVFAEMSPLSHSMARTDKLAQTGTGHGGSGGSTNIDPKWGAAVQNVIIPRAGHFVPFEKPASTAENIARWAQVEMNRIREESQDIQKQSEEMKTGIGKGYMFDEDFLFWMNYEAKRILGKDFMKKSEKTPGSKL